MWESYTCSLTMTTHLYYETCRFFTQVHSLELKCISMGFLYFFISLTALKTTCLTNVKAPVPRRDKIFIRWQFAAPVHRHRWIFLTIVFSSTDRHVAEELKWSVALRWRSVINWQFGGFQDVHRWEQKKKIIRGIQSWKHVKTIYWNII